MTPRTLARLAFEIPGPITPYTRVGQERFTERARRYFASKDNIGLMIRLQMRANGWESIPDRTPFVMRARFARRALWRGDVDNLAKTILDSAQGIVFRDDVFCVRIEAEKERGEDWSWIEFEETEVIE